jgi:hypothetical protein
MVLYRSPRSVVRTRLLNPLCGVRPNHTTHVGLLVWKTSGLAPVNNDRSVSGSVGALDEYL